MKIDCLVVGHHESSYFENNSFNKEKINAGNKASFDSDRSPREQKAFAHYERHKNLYVKRRYVDPLYALSQARWDSNSKPLFTVWELPNLAVWHIVSYLKSRNLSAIGINFPTGEIPEIRNISQECQVLTCAVTTSSYFDPDECQAVIEIIRHFFPQTKIIIGGPYISALAGNHRDLKKLYAALDQIDFDFCIVESQGEETLSKLLWTIKQDSDVSSVPNTIVSRPNGKNIYNRVPDQIKIDQSIVDWNDVPLKNVNPTAQIRTARSCAYNCAFCDFPARMGKLATQPIDIIEKQLRKLESIGIRQVIFIDDTFNVPAKRFNDILKMMIANKFKLGWYSYFRCSDITNRDTYKLMQEANCLGVFLGIESGDASVLRNMQKHAQLSYVKMGLNELNKHGILSFASLIVGFPGETQQSIQNTTDFINDCAPTYYSVQPWFFLTNTPLAKQAGKFNLKATGPWDWQHYSMDIDEALGGMDYMLENITHSRYTTTGELHLWGAAYLIGKGMTRHQLETLHDLVFEGIKLFNKCKDNSGDISTKNQRDQFFDRFNTFCKSLKLDPAVYDLSNSD